MPEGVIPGEFNFEIVSRLPEAERDRKLTAVEALINRELAGAASLGEYQRRLYALTDELNELGFFLGRWDYDSEVEIWGDRATWMRPRKTISCSDPSTPRV